MYLAYASTQGGPLVRIRGLFRSAEAAAQRLTKEEYGEVRQRLKNGQEKATHHVFNSTTFEIGVQA